MRRSRSSGKRPARLRILTSRPRHCRLLLESTCSLQDVQLNDGDKINPPLGMALEEITQWLIRASTLPETRIVRLNHPTNKFKRRPARLVTTQSRSDFDSTFQRHFLRSLRLHIFSTFLSLLLQTPGTRLVWTGVPLFQDIPQQKRPTTKILNNVFRSNNNRLAITVRSGLARQQRALNGTEIPIAPRHPPLMKARKMPAAQGMLSKTIACSTSLHKWSSRPFMTSSMFFSICVSGHQKFIDALNDVRSDPSVIQR